MLQREINLDICVFFKSEILNSIVKVAVCLDINKNRIIVGHLKMASTRECSKLKKHLNTTPTINNTGDGLK